MKVHMAIVHRAGSFPQQVHLIGLNLYAAILLSSLIKGAGSNCSIGS